MFHFFHFFKLKIDLFVTARITRKLLTAMVMGYIARFCDG